ncbi:MAG TPA: carboxypeptidase regulatory-like domain-containing protein [Bryobacterales bacterium]|nr:carboxypeptidase regulatory-like domain-containing protein [Bryobacterales bacterium]
MRNALRGLLAALVGVLLMAPLNAQDITKGSIGGTVRDQTGAVVPNVNVRMHSPNGDREAGTDSAGNYLFSNLIPGPGYDISVDKSGFAPAKVSNVSVSVNQRTTVDLTLTVGAVAATVEVQSVATETIDLASTTVGATLNENLYKNVPVERNISSLMFMAPGVSDGVGSGSANPSINGASGLENEYIINGTNVTDPGFGGFGTYSRVFGSLGNGVNFDFIQEVQVKSGGFEAQYGQALGGVVNVLTKSGSNDLHGSLYGYFQPEGFEATRPNVDLLTVNQTTRILGDGSYDFGGDIGGYIKKDKLFWYGGFNPQYSRSYRAAPPVYKNSGLGEVTIPTRTLNYTGKIDFNLSPNHQFEGLVFGDPATVPIGLTRNTSLASNNDLRASGLDYGSRTWSGRYNGVLSNSWIISANFSDYYNNFTETPKFNGYQIVDNVPVQEKTGGQTTGNGLGFLETTVSTSHQFTVSSSHTGNFLGGHSIMYGYQFEDVIYNDSNLYTGPDFQLPNLPAFGAAAGLTQHGAQLVRTHENTKDPTTPIVLQVNRGNYSNPVTSTLTRYHAAFLQDSWTIGRRLTVRPGLRWEQQAMSGRQLRYVFGGNWAPRIGVIFDPTGHRRSKFFANWGRFFEKIPSDISVRAFSYESSIRGMWYKDQSGTIDLSPANFIPGGKLAASGGPDFLTLVAGGTKAEFQDEVVGGYEHEFNNGMTFSGRFVYRHMRRIIEDTSGINITQNNAGVNQQYVVANPSAHLDIFTNAFPCVATGPNDPKCDQSTGFTPVINPLGSDGIPDGFPNPSRVYQSMELTVSKRFFANWQMYASYRLAKLWGNFEGSFRNDNGQQDPNISSLFDFTNTDGLLTGQTAPGVLPSDRRQELKLFSNYQFSQGFLKNLNLGGSWNIQSGTPITKLLSHPAYGNAGEIPDGARGAFGRTPWTFPLNLHADYTVKLSERKNLKFVADLFNLGNQTRVVRVDQYAELTNATVNPDFLKPDNQLFVYPYQVPFHARLAVRFEF